MTELTRRPAGSAADPAGNCGDGRDEEPGVAVAAVADEHFEQQCALDPVRATLSGAVGFDDQLSDYSPDGWAARAQHCRSVLTRTPETGQDRRLAGILRERLTAELDHIESGAAARLNIVVSPPSLIRECLTTMAPDTEQGGLALAERLRAVPAALEGYARTLTEQVAAGRPAARRQAETVLAACRAWAAGTLFDELASAAVAGGASRSPALRRSLPRAAQVAAAGYHEFADAVQAVLPFARQADGVGAEDYRIAARFMLGVDIDPVDIRDWLAAELVSTRALTERVAAEIDRRGCLESVCAELDQDPSWTVSGADELLEWLGHHLDRSFDIVRARALHVPDALRTVHTVVATSSPAGPVRYLPPAADLSRPGRVMWSLPPGATGIPVWSQVTTVHHEGVPGHHLQIGAAVLDHGMSAWQRHTVVPGHAEGWAVYAEGLMAELGGLEQPPARLGYLLGLRLNAAVALADLVTHTGLRLPDGVGGDPDQPWTPQAAVAFLGRHGTVPPATLYLSELRCAAWPAQALTYSYGARAWGLAREAVRARMGDAFDARTFHAEMLGIGPCGLAALAEAADPPD